MVPKYPKAHYFFGRIRQIAGIGLSFPNKRAKPHLLYALLVPLVRVGRTP